MTAIDGSRVLSLLNNRIPRPVSLCLKSTVIKSKPKNSSYLRKSTEQVRGAQAPKEQVTKTEPTSIFRQTYFSMDEGFQDMLTLKRANPVCDSSDEEEFESPTKRTRVFDEDNRDESAQERHAEPQILDWRDHQPEDEIEGFQLSRLLH